MPLVRHTGDQGTFSVSSADDTDPYTVDLMANEGFMACTCRDWECRCAPITRLRRPLKEHGKQRGYCKHIKDVLIYLGADVWRNMFGDYEPLDRLYMDAIYLAIGQRIAAQLNGKERTDIFEDKL